MYLVIFGVLLISGLVWMGVRKVSAAAGSSSRSFVISRMKRNANRAHTFADRLDIPLERRENIQVDEARSVIQKLAVCPSIKTFTIDYAQLLDTDRLLMFTSVKYKDLEVLPGRGGMVPIDVTRTAHHEFLIQYVPSTSTFLVNSDLFSTSTERLQKNEFTRHITSLL